MPQMLLCTHFFNSTFRCGDMLMLQSHIQYNIQLNTEYWGVHYLFCCVLVCVIVPILLLSCVVFMVTWIPLDLE